MGSVIPVFLFVGLETGDWRLEINGEKDKYGYFDSRAFMIIATSRMVASPGSWYSPSVS
jgi:hypothetical protein